MPGALGQEHLLISLKVYSLILASSFYVINIISRSGRKVKSKILAYSDFALASCTHQRVLLMLH